MSGYFLNKNGLYALNYLGEGELDGERYNLLCTDSYSPVIECRRTGRKYAWLWTDLVRQAIAAGIDNDPDDVCPVCGEQGYGDDPKNCSFCEDQREIIDRGVGG